MNYPSIKNIALTGLTVTGSQATAAIIYTDIADLTLTFQNGDELYIDFTNQSAVIQASSVPSAEIFIADYSSDDFTIESPQSQIARTGSNLLEYSAGDIIGSGSSFGAYGDVRDGSTFDTSTGQYAGVRLDSGNNYGWIQLSFDAAANTITVYDFAYDDSGTPIAAGAGAIPEPSSAALLLVGSAAALKRRRK
ncbi:PEP-CTERM sorting domain-containing protein [Rubritalea marina]|uniref:PEP-CTERM sorting domain-containing protein n=1 Tax=Rubritalea marina TaxID=361055 RepID=UPI000372F2B9|nr:PEP-CTERM sorting domain-containing protein [Rubritalea marina]